MNHAEQMEAIEAIEEMAILLAEVHLRFKGALILNEEFTAQDNYSYGDAAHFYMDLANRLRATLPKQ